MGACFGSFFNVCIYRIPKRKSIIFPLSFCPECKHHIPWYNNIPLLSYFLLKGKCRFCKAKISIIYPLVEFISAVVFLITFLNFGISIKLLIHLVLFSLLIIISFIDIKEEIVPDILIISGIIFGISTSFFTISLHSSILGIAIGAAVTWGFATIGKFLFKKEAMGGGDIKFLAMIGSFIGWVAVLWTLFLGSIIGLIFGLILKHKKFPFALFLSIGAFMVLIFFLK